MAPQPWPNGCAAGRKRLGQGYAPRRGSRQRRPVRGSFSTGVWSHELAHLYLALHELWRGFGAARAVDFALREQTLALSIALAHSGHVALTFDARDDPAGETALHGALTAEHAALARWLVSLYRVLQRFPPQLPTPRLPPPPPADGERG